MGCRQGTLLTYPAFSAPYGESPERLGALSHLLPESRQLSGSMSPVLISPDLSDEVALARDRITTIPALLIFALAHRLSRAQRVVGHDALPLPVVYWRVTVRRLWVQVEHVT